jgi:hypothetical protein
MFKKRIKRFIGRNSCEDKRLRRITRRDITWLCDWRTTREITHRKRERKEKIKIRSKQ